MFQDTLLSIALLFIKTSSFPISRTCRSRRFALLWVGGAFRKQQSTCICRCVISLFGARRSFESSDSESGRRSSQKTKIYVNLKAYTQNYENKSFLPTVRTPPHQSHCRLQCFPRRPTTFHEIAQLLQYILQPEPARLPVKPI